MASFTLTKSPRNPTVKIWVQPDNRHSQSSITLANVGKVLISNIYRIVNRKPFFLPDLDARYGRAHASGISISHGNDRDMKKHKYITRLRDMSLIFVCILMSACSTPSEREQTVGRDHRLFFDEERPSWVQEGKRPLAATIWYPSAVGSDETNWNIAIFKAGRNALNADFVSTPEKFPLVVLSHGTGGAAFQLSWLAEILAENGFIVLAVNHHGNTGAEDALLLEGFVLWWERALDISSAIDHLLSDPIFGPRVDLARIAAAGFSLGGYSVISVAGGITDLEQWKVFCLENKDNPVCILPPEAGVNVSTLEAEIKNNSTIQHSVSRSGENLLDRRIKAVYSIAPVLGPVFTQDSLEKISIPVQIVVGANDNQAIPKYNAEPIAASIPNAKLVQLPNVTHYTFLARCNLKGKLLVGNLCSDPKGIDRGEVHKKIGMDAASFFTNELNTSKSM